jgi:mannose-6-phosphate isomerase-like protein (cupin superfamily)
MTSVIDVMNDDGFQLSQTKDEEGIGTAWRKDLIVDAGRGVAVMIWKADTGYFESAQPPYAETFVVLSGTADCSIGAAPFAAIGPGSIVHMPSGAGMRLRVKTPYRMMATVITDELRFSNGVST